MIISRTPMRVSMFGGSTDLPAWYKEHGGAVLGAAIDKYAWLTVRKLPSFFDYKHRIVYSQTETVRHVDEIQHPAVREVLKFSGVTHGLSISHDGDLPARTGLGSSSSFVVGLLNALYAMRGHMLPPDRMVDTAIMIEREYLKETVGDQDQTWAVHGGFNRIDFRRDGTRSVTPIIVSDDRKQELQDSLMLFYLGTVRHASVIEAKKVENFGKRTEQLKSMLSMVDDAQAILQNPHNDLKWVGSMLDEAWRHKKALSDGVSTSEIDDVYKAARAAGALGGKVLGAGGGGFILFYVPQAAKKAVRQALSKLVEVDFRLGAEGSKIVVYDPEG